MNDPRPHGFQLSGDEFRGLGLRCVTPEIILPWQIVDSQIIDGKGRVICQLTEADKDTMVPYLEMINSGKRKVVNIWETGKVPLVPGIPLYVSNVGQRAEELDQLIELVRTENVRSYLEIGSAYGGSLWQIANAMPKRLQRNVCIQVVIPGIEAAADCGRRCARLGLTYYHVEFASHPDRLPNRILIGKQPLCRVVGQYDDLFAAVARSEPSSTSDLQLIELEVILDATHELRVYSPISQAQFEAKLTHRHRAANGWNVLDDSTVVVSQQTIRLNTTVGFLL